jgi:hypothetical protein
MSEVVDELEWQAQTEKYDLEAESQLCYGYGSGWLTVGQMGEMIPVIAARRADIINRTRATTTVATTAGRRRCTSTGIAATRPATLRKSAEAVRKGSTSP